MNSIQPSSHRIHGCGKPKPDLRIGFRAYAHLTRMRTANRKPLSIVRPAQPEVATASSTAIVSGRRGMQTCRLLFDKRRVLLRSIIVNPSYRLVELRADFGPNHAASVDSSSPLGPLSA